MTSTIYTLTPPPLRQSEQITAALGSGAVLIQECSNRAAENPLPLLTLMLPAETEVLNQGHTDAIVAHHPAESMRLYDKPVRQLYEALHAYYRRSGKHLTS